MILRPARAAELSAVSALCLRSKAVWGYPPEFIEACRAELTLGARDIDPRLTAVAELGGRPVGIVQITVEGEMAELQKLFVEPTAMGRGIGAALLRWGCAAAAQAGAERLAIEADPDAAPFYRRLGATSAGDAPSGSIPGRRLPRFVLALSGQ